MLPVQTVGNKHEKIIVLSEAILMLPVSACDSYDRINSEPKDFLDSNEF